MCGIAGIAFSKQSRRRVDEQLLRRMSDVLVHRGPDDAGIFIAENVGLAHRRLSIVDVGGGRQPMANEDGSLQIVFNGEIYNHRDLREELISKNHVYQSRCDTETILHLYEERGARSVEKLRGMFAFAIWNSAKKELFLARDRLGVKPLYYVLRGDGSLVFASEIKSLFETGLVKPEINFAALPDRLANRGTSGEETLFRNVKKLLPGHFLIWRSGGAIEIQKYWDVRFEPKTPVTNEREIVAEWLDSFKKSIELHLMADVPLGVFLSGGIDSSAIAAMMRTSARETVKTFSVAFHEREANELEFARLVARKFKTEHHEITVSPQEFFGALPELIWHGDEPLGFIASVPLYFVARLAQRQRVKVVLTGEGSDEILGGYGRYRKTLLNLAFGKNYEMFAPRAVRTLVKNGIGNLPENAQRKLARTFLTLPNNLENLYFDNFAVFGGKMQEKLLSDETKKRIGEPNPYQILGQILSETDAANLLDKLLFADAKTYLQQLLMKQDRMSMAASVESRVPFLDHKLVEFAARLPEKFKIRGSQTKWILREAMRDFLPKEILSRPKMGFPVPLGRWLRGEFKSVVDEFVLSERALARNIFNARFVRELVARHNRGENHDERIWFLINFEIWQRQFIEGEKLWN